MIRSWSIPYLPSFWLPVIVSQAKPSDTAGASPEPPTPGTDLVPDADVALNHMDDAETLDEVSCSTVVSMCCLCDETCVKFV